ncbi:phosphate ABC transporter permease, partial [Pantoea sp. SIMBA_133]
SPVPEQIVTSADDKTLLLNAQGSLPLLQPVISQGEGDWHFPLGDKVFRLPQGGIKKMALATISPDPGRIAASGESGVNLL